MAPLRTIKLNTGAYIPIVGLGTWQSESTQVQSAVKSALESGYRHVDCAFVYENENEVGTALREAITEGSVTRGELFIVSKLWNTCHRDDDVKPNLMMSLKNLGLDYLDLYLIHWPVAFKAGAELCPRDMDGKLQYDDVSLLETWKALEECVDLGLVKAIGVSNFNRHQIQEVLNNCRIKPANLQVEIHPYLSQVSLVEFAHSHGIAVTAYSPLCSGSRPLAQPQAPALLQDEVVLSIAEKYGKSAAQVVIRWAIQRGLVVIPKSVTPSRIHENIAVFDFELTTSEMTTISGFNRDLRLIRYGNGTTDIVPTVPHFPFAEEYQ